MSLITKPIGQFSRCVIVSVLLVTLSILEGCAVSPEFREKSEPQAISLVPKQGVVMVKVGSNRNFGAVTGKWQSLRIVNIDTKETFSLIDQSPAHNLHSFYVGSVPAGTYQLVRFASQAQGAISVYSSADLGPKLGRFVVSEGKVTDLGTILYLRPYLPVNTSLFKIAFASLKLESDQSLSSLNPLVAEAAKNGNPGWLPLSNSEERVPYINGTVSPSMFLNDPHPTKDGSMVFGEALGQVSKRDKDGNWSYFNTGTLNTILSVYSTNNGSIIAGSEQSLLLMKSGKEDLWSVIPIPLTDASIRFIGEHPKLGYVVVAQDRRNIVVLICDDISKPQWSELKQIPVELFINRTSDTEFSVLLTQKNLIVVTKSSAPFNLKTAFHVLDLENKLWSEVPIDFYALRFTAMIDGNVYTMAGPYPSQKFYVSKDNGIKWEKRASPNWLTQPIFRNADEGYAIRTDDIPLIFANNLTHSIWKTEDGGNTWSKIGGVVPKSNTLVFLEQNGHMLLVTTDGKLLLSKDNGFTWDIERTIQ